MTDSIDRRSILAAGAGIGLTGLLPSAYAAAGPGDRPNILFIMADDLGYADLGCYGQRAFATPALDGLAKAGLRLTDGYANSAVCSATRTALVTGRYQYRLRVGLEEPIAREDPALRLPPGHPTLPSLFKALGYRTALVGKWHIGFGQGDGPVARGYDHFFGIPGGGADYFTHRIMPTAAMPNDGLFLGDRPTTRPGYMTELLGDEAVRWIGQDRAAAPFFLSLHFTAPHWPWQGPDDEAASRDRTDVYDRDRGNLETYGRMVASMDANVARVLAAVDRLGAARDTIVIFTSDNGGERFSDTWPFTGTKGELLEGGIRVPLIVRWPRRIRAGGTSAQVMTSMDFLPTLLAAAGGAADPRYPSDGLDLLPQLTGAAPARPRKLYWRFKGGDQAALRDGDWKYLRLGGKEHLFNLAEDARERADRKTREPARFAAMKADWTRWNADMLAYPPSSITYSPDLIDADRY